MAVVPELHLDYWGKLICDQFSNRVSSNVMLQMGSETLIHTFMISNLDYSHSLPPGLLQVSHWKKKR